MPPARRTEVIAGLTNFLATSYIIFVNPSTDIESAAGIEVGGRTGLTSVVTALCFLPCLFVAPLAQAVPQYATAPVLLLVGGLMFASVRELPSERLEDALPAYLSIVLIPLTFSITQGILWGIISHVGLYLLAGRAREVHPVMYGLGVCSRPAGHRARRVRNGKRGSRIQDSGFRIRRLTAEIGIGRSPAPFPCPVSRFPDSPIPRFRESRILIPESWFPFLDSPIPRFPDSPIPRFPDSPIPPIPRIPNPDSRILFPVSRFPIT